MHRALVDGLSGDPAVSVVTDPEVLAFIAQSEAHYPADANLASVEDNRRIYDAMCAAFRRPRPADVTVEDGAVPATEPERRIPVRLYRRAGEAAPAIVLYSHGGGFVVGGLESHDDVCAELCEATGCTVVASDYRLAPEHLFPAQIDDVAAVYRYLLDQGLPVVVVGDSAGGNLSAALCLRARRLGWRAPAGQVLVYPGLGGDIAALPSYRENAEAPMLRTVDVEHYATVLTGGHPRSEIGDPELSPLAATDFSGLPPALIVTADVDPLRDDGRLYAQKLRAAGVPATWRNEPELVHGYQRARHMSRRARESFDAVCEAVKAMARGA